MNMRKRIYYESGVSIIRASKGEISPVKVNEERRKEFLKLRAEKRRIKAEKRAEKKYREARRAEFLRANGIIRESSGTAKARKNFELNRVKSDAPSITTTQSIWTVKRR